MPAQPAGSGRTSPWLRYGALRPTTRGEESEPVRRGFDTALCAYSPRGEESEPVSPWLRYGALRLLTPAARPAQTVQVGVELARPSLAQNGAGGDLARLPGVLEVTVTDNRDIAAEGPVALHREPLGSTQ